MAKFRAVIRIKNHSVRCFSEYILCIRNVHRPINSTTINRNQQMFRKFARAYTFPSIFNSMSTSAKMSSHPSYSAVRFLSMLCDYQSRCGCVDWVELETGKLWLSFQHKQNCWAFWSVEFSVETKTSHFVMPLNQHWIAAWINTIISESFCMNPLWNGNEFNMR